MLLRDFAAACVPVRRRKPGLLATLPLTFSDKGPSSLMLKNKVVFTNLGRHIKGGKHKEALLVSGKHLAAMREVHQKQASDRASDDNLADTCAHDAPATRQAAGIQPDSHAWLRPHGLFYSANLERFSCAHCPSFMMGLVVRGGTKPNLDRYT